MFVGVCVVVCTCVLVCVRGPLAVSDGAAPSQN